MGSHLLLACHQERLRRPQTECDEEGNYRAKQCRTVGNGGGLMCRCVSMNGTEVEGTERPVRSREDGPDCGNSLLSLSMAGQIAL